MLKSSNQELKSSNQNFKILLLSIGLGVVIWFIIQKSKPKLDEMEKY